jgi:glucosyl-3-phosphoglycerate synthase
MTVPAATIASYAADDWSLDDLVASKRGRRIVVCIPALNESATIGHIVSGVNPLLEARLVDEILVVDDASTDGTASTAAEAGASVVRGPGLGKGEAMRQACGRGDVIVYLDGDVTNFTSSFVTGLLGPLLCRGYKLVKGAYGRPLCGEDGGGRVTELVAKPLISLLFPALVSVDQPLAGETAVSAEVLASIELEGGYGVEIGLLLDVWKRWGTEAIAQMDLGERRHRNRPLAELAPQAREVISATLARASDRLSTST